MSVVIMEKKSDEEVFVDTWLMSCRVLKRGMEEYIINRMVQEAADRGFKTILAEYIATPKNRMVKDIYEKMGFSRIDENKFKLNVSDFNKLKTYIMEAN